MQIDPKTPDTILKVDHLTMHFPLKKGLIFQKNVGSVKAVDDVSLELHQGETLGLVGESGCGKTTLGRTLIRLYKPTSGSIVLNNKDIASLSGQGLREARRDFQMIFQDPYASLDPRMTVFDILAEPLRAFKLYSSRQDLEKQVTTLMENVGLSPRFIRKYPHEFSGGQRQRIAIARALAIRPKLVICDEPVSALDVSIQAQILNLLKNLQKEFNLTYIFIAHDISVVRHISDRIAVMYLGKIVELAHRDELFKNPQHPYTQALLSAVPIADPRKERDRKRIILKGDLPSPLNPPSGCAFHPRCPMAMETCKVVMPPEALVKATNYHMARCHLATQEVQSCH